MCVRVQCEPCACAPWTGMHTRAHNAGCGTKMGWSRRRGDARGGGAETFLFLRSNLRRRFRSSFFFHSAADNSRTQHTHAHTHTQTHTHTSMKRKTHLASARRDGRHACMRRRTAATSAMQPGASWPAAPALSSSELALTARSCLSSFSVLFSVSFSVSSCFFSFFFFSFFLCISLSTAGQGPDAPRLNSPPSDMASRGARGGVELTAGGDREGRATLLR